MMHGTQLLSVFRRHGEAASYQPPGGGEAVACRAIPQAETSEINLSGVRVQIGGRRWHLLRSQFAATPVIDGVLTIGGQAHQLDLVEPAPKDPFGLKWQVWADWGVPITYAPPGQPSEAPLQGGPWRIAAGAPVGAVTISITSQYINVFGKLSAGDTVIIGGAAYGVTADVQAVGSKTFNAVPISPALAFPVSAGDAVSITPAATTAEYTVRAAVADYAASEIMGAVLVGDRRLIVPAAALSMAGFVSAPVPGGTVEMNGKTLSVVTPRAHYEGEAVAVWELQVRG